MNIIDAFLLSNEELKLAGTRNRNSGMLILA
jgi:hypothetical protein